MNRALRPRAVTAPTPSPSSKQGLRWGLLLAARPKHWLKNLLVFAAPTAAGVLGHPRILARTGGAFIIFCVLASGIYLLNDAIDAPADRCHPVKRRRPIASGVVPAGTAIAAGAVLLLAGLGASAILGWRMVVVSSTYVTIQLGYSLWLKHEPIFDLACVAGGFVLRAIAGGVAGGLPISQWFLIVASFGSMLMVTGKRFAEHQQLGQQRGSHRPSLDAYSEAFLRGMMYLSAAVATTAYCLWAFQKQSQQHTPGSGIVLELSIVPFVLGILRYAYLADIGQGARPEDVVLSDHTMQLVVAVWVALFALGSYVH